MTTSDPATTMGADLRIEPWTDDTMPEVMDIMLTSFQMYPSEQLLGNVLANLPDATARHLDVTRSTTHPTTGIRCVHRSPTTGADTTVATAEWTFYLPATGAREPAAYETPHPHLAAAHLPPDSAAGAAARTTLGAVHAGRVRTMGGRPHVVLMYMATADDWRRRGAASACVAWGLARCAELGVPALLEASPLGRPVYARLGFEEIDEVVWGDAAGEAVRFPVMVWWPENVPVEERVRVLPDWKPREEGGKGGAEGVTTA